MLLKVMVACPPTPTITSERKVISSVTPPPPLPSAAVLLVAVTLAEARLRLLAVALEVAAVLGIHLGNGTLSLLAILDKSLICNLNTLVGQMRKDKISIAIYRNPLLSAQVTEMEVFPYLGEAKPRRPP
jgi:hypothetical protein